MVKDVPLFLLAAAVLLYWGTVVLLASYKRVRHGRSAGIIPRQRYERRLWRLILPAVGAWIVLPVLALTVHHPWFTLPAWAAGSSLVYALRVAAAGVAAVCYLLSLVCWFSLGRNWSMAVVPGQTSQLVTGGIYRWVRHPIYALSVCLMVASAVILPTVLMAVVACVHVTAMNLKALNEERYLTKSFGPSYSRYCEEVGRFWPRWTSELRKSA